MEKNDMLRDFYISQITQFIEACTDLSLLDFVYRLLKKSTNEKNENA